MDTHSEVVDLRAYVEGLCALAGDDVQITGFQFLQLIGPVSERLGWLEGALLVTERDIVRA